MSVDKTKTLDPGFRRDPVSFVAQQQTLTMKEKKLSSKLSSLQAPTTT
jgi:hypothetical protein